MPVRPSIDRFGGALVIAILLHLLILVSLSLHLHFAQPPQIPPAATQIQASLISSSQVAAPLTDTPAPIKTPSPSAEPMAKQAIQKHPAPEAPLIVKQAPTPKPVIEQAPEPKPVIKPVVESKPIVEPTSEAKPVVEPPPETKPDLPKTVERHPTKRVAKMKQQSMQQALQEEEQSATSMEKTKPVDKKLLADAFSSEIAAEAKQDKATMPSANTVNKPNSAEVDRYKAMILQQIQQNWIVPLHVEHLSCELRVELAPGGSVLKVTLLKSSGNDALDRSAIAAINKASPLPTPQKTGDFDAFRSFTITVKPEGSSFEVL